MSELDEICTVEELRAIYRTPRGGPIDKQHDRITDHDRAFIAHSPFVVVATADAGGQCDVSPKGGTPGFVTVLDDRTLGIPDLAGNNRLDSMQNIVANPGIGLLFMIPGLDETLRVNGSARLVTDATVRQTSAVGDAVPKVVFAVDVAEVFLHCAKALRRGAIWKPEQWPDTSDMPSVATMLRDLVAPDVEVEVVEQALEESYEKTLWQAPQ